MNRRLGRFEIAGSILRERAKDVLPLMTGVLAARVDYVYETDTFAYTALHQDFDEVPPGCVAPRYQALLANDAEGHVVSVTWKRVEC